MARDDDNVNDDDSGGDDDNVNDDDGDNGDDGYNGDDDDIFLHIVTAGAAASAASRTKATHFLNE